MSEQNSLRRFLFEELGIRGEWVKLTTSWQAAKAHQCASDIVQQQLGQALAAVVMLSATIKFKGAMILQIQSEGAIKTMVAQATNERKIRGLVRINEHAPQTPLFGQEGRLVLTIESNVAKPYQGIVLLRDDNLASSLQTYFEQSEQLKTRLWLFANATQAVGLLIQELPSHEQSGNDNSWQSIEILANTITEKELLELDCESVLHRLFHEEKIRLFEAQSVEFQCSCSHEIIERTLRAMGKEELEAILQEQGECDITCEFCGQRYTFNKEAIETMLLSVETDNTAIRH